MFLANEIGFLGKMDDEWKEWEYWFAEIRESHLSYPALNFFRSPHVHDSWILTAGNVLDTASFIESTVDVPMSIQARLCIRSGFLALQEIAEHYRIPFNPDPEPTDSVSYKKEDFKQLCKSMQDMGLQLKPDLEQAWRDFSGWRVNYDNVLRRLEALINF